MAIDCPDCMSKHNADVAQTEEWRRRPVDVPARLLAQAVVFSITLAYVDAFGSPGNPFAGAIVFTLTFVKVGLFAINLLPHRSARHRRHGDVVAAIDHEGRLFDSLQVVVFPDAAFRVSDNRCHLSRSDPVVRFRVAVLDAKVFALQELSA